MKKALLFTLLLTVSLVYAAETKLGKAITLKDKSAITKILHHPDQFEGKTVLVEGKVLGVCKEKGCWIEVAGAKEGEKIKVKVEDGVIVFPKDAKGKTALVEGTVEEVKGDSCAEHKKETKTDKVTKEEKAGCAKESAEAGCCSGEQTTKVYQIKGLGAVIK